MVAIPPGPLVLNEDNPLTLGLIGCFVPGVMRGQNLSGQQPDLLFEHGEPAGVWGTGPEGPCLVSHAAGHGLSRDAPQSWRTAPMTLYWRGFRSAPAHVSPGSGWAGIFGVSFDRFTTAPFVNFAMLRSPPANPNQFRAVWNSSGFSQQTSELAGISDSSFSVAMCVASPPSPVRVFANGVLVASNLSMTSQPSTSITTVIGLNTDENSPARFPNLSCYCAYAWNRQLSDLEIANLDANPYGLVKTEPQEPEPPPEIVRTMAMVMA